jgi:glycosyltransferase involved in cell wall biosynthesis
MRHDRPIAIVVHAVVPGDPRIRRQTDALIGAGYHVDVIALREPGQAAREEIGKLRILRLPVRRQASGFVGHLAEYAAFAALATWRLTVEHRRRGYGLVQVATLPDFLVVAASPLKLSGVPLLLDLHEDMPAFFEDRFTAVPLRPMRPVVRGVARGAAAMADHVLTVHEPLRALSVARDTPRDKVSVVMNSADERLFDPNRHPRRPFMADGELRLVHHSALQRIYGLETALRALALLGERSDVPPVHLDVYGDGPYRPQLDAMIERLGLGPRVKLHGRVAIDALPPLLATADVGLVPSLPEPYMQLSLSTKLLEYVAMGVPVIATDLRTFRAHFDETALCYVPGDDPRALANAIAAAAADAGAFTARAAEAQRQAAPYAWSIQAERYLEVIRRLLDDAVIAAP